MMKKPENRKGMIITILASVLVLGISCFFGEREMRKQQEEAAALAAELAASEAKEAVPELSEKEREVLEKLEKGLAKGELKETAILMEENQELLAGLFYDTFEGQRFLFDGEEIRLLEEGTGLVFTKPGTVFYGSFREGNPEGDCLALQIVNLDGPRYDYSHGLWKNGMMEGRGSVGYCYYKNVPEGEHQEVKKTGTWKGDLLDGDITYETVDSQGKSASWQLSAKEGVTDLTRDWTYLEEEGEYQLMSKDSKGYAYVLEESQADFALWRNLIVWEE